MDPEKKRRRDERRRRHQEWLENDPLNRRLRAAIERYRALAEAKRRDSS